MRLYSYVACKYNHMGEWAYSSVNSGALTQNNFAVVYGATGFTAVMFYIYIIIIVSDHAGGNCSFNSKSG